MAQQTRIETDCCECDIIHVDAISRARAAALPEETVGAVADLFKVFGDATRVRLLWGLAGGELCVCDLAALLSMTPSAISHQLRILKQARLVRSRRDGKIVYYAQNDEHIGQIFAQALTHVREPARF
ncbi:Transcriptional repressor SmtB [bioreactor metagenome]|uniref:Transcriptional repressor SmtB n=1 Tax=bioreactor metagenome TaxID=1076179 RepID=A0A645H9I4_9ZZZZ